MKTHTKRLPEGFLEGAQDPPEGMPGEVEVPGGVSGGRAGDVDGGLPGVSGGGWWGPRQGVLGVVPGGWAEWLGVPGGWLRGVWGVSGGVPGG